MPPTFGGYFKLVAGVASQASLVPPLQMLQQKHPNLTVVSEFWRGVELEGEEALLNTFNKGIPPAIGYIRRAPGGVNRLVNSGALKLHDLTDWAQNRLSNQIPESFLEGCKKDDGSLFCLPITWSVMGLFYNPLIFRKHNLSIPTTFDQLLMTCDKFKSTNDTVPMPHNGMLGLTSYNDFLGLVGGDSSIRPSSSRSRSASSSITENVVVSPAQNIILVGSSNPNTDAISNDQNNTNNHSNSPDNTTTTAASTTVRDVY